MKRTFLTLALLIGVSAASTTVANDGMAIVNLVGSELNVKAMKGLKFRLTATNLDQKALVEIKDNTGQVLFTEYCGKDANYAKIFDLSYLADGNYTFVVKNGEETIVKPFTIETKRTVSLTK
jgi:hypothetical protein